MRKLIDGVFSLAPFMFVVLLILTVSMRFSGHSLAKPANWTQVWGTEFDGPVGSGVDTSSYWQYDHGHGYKCSGCPANWGTGEIESMSDSTTNVYRDGKGHLVIKAIRDASGNWTSGRIETKRTDFAAPPGGQLKITASLQQPNVTGAAGYWPAFFMLGAQFRDNFLNWPGVGEVSIMENANGRSSEFATLHCGVVPGGPCNEFTGLSSGEHSCQGCQSAFHTYTVIIDRSVSPEQIRWYLDGKPFFSVNAGQVPASVWSAAVDHSFLIGFSLAIGGALPMALGGGPNATTVSGSSLMVDYVHVYTANGAIESPTSGNPGEVKIVENNGKYAFSPATLTISKGTKVVWTNTSDAPHTVTSDDGKFTSSNAANSIAKNQTYSFVFNTAGTFKYHCSIHPYMTATITVTSATMSP
jgi:plastocyanin